MSASIPLPPDYEDLFARVAELTPIGRRLARGECPQAILDDVMDIVINDENAGPFWAADVIVLLADRGARVATDQPGCALENLIRQPVRARPALIMDIALRLAGTPGELPFHVLAKHFPVQLSPDRLRQPDVQASLLARDSLGRTVSHWLWAPDSALVMQIRSSRDTATGDRRSPIDEIELKLWLSNVRRVWLVQEEILSVGSRMDAPDHMGRTAMDLCADRLDAGEACLLPAFHSCQQVQAHQMRRSLLASTPLVAPARPGPRL